MAATGAQPMLLEMSERQVLGAQQTSQMTCLGRGCVKTSCRNGNEQLCGFAVLHFESFVFPRGEPRKIIPRSPPAIVFSHSLGRNPKFKLTLAKDFTCRSFAPARHDKSAVSVRDYCSGFYR